MNRYHFISLLLFLLGIVFLVTGIVHGEVEIGFAFIFPFIIGTGVYVAVAVVLISSSMFFFMLGFIISHTDGMLSYDDETHYTIAKRKIEGGGIVFVGPIPIVFGSNWKITILLISLAIVFMILVISLMILL